MARAPQDQQKLVHHINDASDAFADAAAMVWAVFHIVQGMPRDELQDALTACCNQALAGMNTGAALLEGIAAGERAKEDA